MNNLTHAFFLAFRGKEMLLVRGTEESPDEWGFPVGIFGDEPAPEQVEMVLKEKYFREVIVRSVRKIKPGELGKLDTDQDVNIESLFVDSPIYLCDITGIAKLGPVFFVKNNNATDLQVSERTRVILSSKYVRSRLS